MYYMWYIYIIYYMYYMLLYAMLLYAFASIACTMIFIIWFSILCSILFNGCYHPHFCNKNLRDSSLIRVIQVPWTLESRITYIKILNVVSTMSPNDDKILTITCEGYSVYCRGVCRPSCKTENLITVKYSWLNLSSVRIESHFPHVL